MDPSPRRKPNMPYDAHLLDLMRQALSKRPGIQERKMFGGFCWMLNGNMLCGVEVGRFMFRVGKELEDEALRRPGSTRSGAGPDQLPRMASSTRSGVMGSR